MSEAHETYTALVLSGLARRKLVAGESLLRLLPRLAEGTLLSADLALRAKLGYVAVELRLEAQPRGARVRQRLAFWLAREGGWSRPIESMSPDEAARFRETLERSDLCLREVSPEHWADAVRRVFEAAGTPAPAAQLADPELRLHIGGTGWHGFTFEPFARLLQVPSPLAPPAGDVLQLAIAPAGVPGELCCARATVVSVRRPADASPRAPAGFTLALDAASGDASVLLASRCPQPGAVGTKTRAAPRYHVVGGVRLTEPDEELQYGSDDEFLRDYITNLSHGGAFVRTSQVRAIGDRVNLHVRLAGREPIRVPAMVVHRSEGGVGLQFELTGSVEAALCAAVAGLSARPRRALIVDDDHLVRRVLVDAFAARGFETLTATDGQEGLRMIVDELFALDAVVTDVHMPGLSGDALVSAVRKAGGEAELVLVAVTADSTQEVVARLGAAGADAVVSKAAGPARVVAEVEAALRRRTAAELAAFAAGPAGAPLRASVG
jgi:CheY-like chemotaxis protein